MADDHGGNQPAAPTSTSPIATSAPKEQEGSLTPQIKQKIPVATHSGHHNKTPKDDFRRVEASQRWQNQEWSPLELIDWISSGKAWVACHLAGGNRNEESAGISDLIVLDVDGDITLEAFWAIHSVQRHCLFTATSCSHTPEEHRFRAVFRCERHDDPKLHRAIYHQLLAALGLKLKDNSGEKPERLWFGNTAAAIEFGGGEPLSWELIENARDALKAAAQARAERSALASTGDQATDNQRAAWVLEQLLRPSADGEFQAYWSPLLNAAAATGDDAVRDAFMVWHHKGHHSKTQSRVAKRLDQAGTRLTPGEGAGRILQFAKQQFGEQWWRLLPESLWYGGGGGSKQPISLMKARSADDIAPQDYDFEPDLCSFDSDAEAATSEPGGLRSLFRLNRATGANGTGAVPDKMPSALELQRLATVAPQPAATTGADAVSQSALIEHLLCQLYYIETECILLTEQGEEKLTDEAARYKADQLESELLALPVFRSNPQRIRARLLQIFCDRNGIRQRTTRALKPELALQEDDIPNEWLLDGLFVQGASYMIYSLPAMGKTTIALTLARAALGTPGHEDFLGFKATPREPFSQSRVLYIASDGDRFAKGDVNTYLKKMKQSDEEWMRYMPILSANRNNDAAAWRMDLQGFHHLAAILDEMETAGTPVRMLIVDSLKACMPEGMRVGDQDVTRLLQAMEGLCEPRNITVVYLHHQGKESENPQGVAGLTEMVHGYFRIRVEENQHYFCLNKLRSDRNSSYREIPYKVTSEGRLVMAEGSADDGRDPIERLLITIFAQHYDKHLKITAHLEDGNDFAIYKGLQRSDLPILIRQHGESNPKWGNPKNLDRILAALVKDGDLQKLDRGRFAIGHVAQHDPIEQGDFDLPGW